MGKKKNTETRDPRETARIRIRRILQFSAWTAGLVAVFLSGAWLVWRGERFLVEDPRFQIAEAEPGRADDAVTITGARHAVRSSLLAVFAEDRGRSLYRLDPEQRRRALQRVEWVQDAAVRRVWPNRVAVEITERTPVAFIQAPVRRRGLGPVQYQPLLIDGDGVLLTPRGEVPDDLPLVSGVRETDHPEVRRTRIRRVMLLLDELGEARSNLDEIDIANIENLKAVYRLHEREYILVLGNEQYAKRFERFTRGYPEWKNNLPPRAIIDLTHESRVITTPLVAAQ
jgi:cell division septal protein FtsQ